MMVDQSADSPPTTSHKIAQPNSQSATISVNRDAALAPADAKSVNMRDVPTASFVAVGPEKLLTAGIDPNNKTCLHVRINLFNQHPINISRMPPGNWTIDHLINMLSHPTIGLGIKCPKVPRSMIESVDNEKANKQHEAVISFLESRMVETELLSCISSTEWNKERSKLLFTAVNDLDKQLTGSLDNNQLVCNWAGLLRTDSTIVGVHSSNSQNSTSMILKFDNHHVCLLVALHLLTWSCIPDLHPQELIAVHKCLGVSINGNESADWQQNGTRARDRKQSTKAGSIGSVVMKKTGLTAIDKMVALNPVAFLTSAASTALSVADSRVQFGKSRWMSVMMKGVPWSRLHYSVDNFRADSNLNQWLANEVKHSHRLFTYETRPEPRVAIARSV